MFFGKIFLFIKYRVLWYSVKLIFYLEKFYIVNKLLFGFFGKCGFYVVEIEIFWLRIIWDGVYKCFEWFLCNKLNIGFEGSVYVIVNV